MLHLIEITLTGRLGKNPEMHTRKDGETFVTLSIASHSKDEEPTWYQVIVNGTQAQYAWENYRIGEPILVRGQFRVKKWQDKNGESRLTFQVVAGIMTSLVNKTNESPALKETALDTHHKEHDEIPKMPSSPTTPKSTKGATFGKTQYRNRRAT